MKRIFLTFALFLFASAARAATLISTASGNIDATATWSVVDTTGTNAYLNSESANTALTTSAVASSTFTPAAETTTEIGVKLASITASPTGTLTVKLANSTAPGSRECSQTVNVSDLVTAAASTAEGGWVILACSAALNGTDSYTIQASASVASQVNLFSSATTNWSHLLVTNGTKTNGPAAGDKIIVSGELTGAGTHNAYTVTIETTALVNYGNVANTLVDPSIAIGQYGTLQFASAASTAYVSEFAGPMVIYNGGTFTVGTSGTTIPATSSATLTLNSTVEGDTGINVRNGGTFDSAGSSGGRGVVRTHLTAQATGGVTSTLTTQDNTAWLSGDQIYIAGTSITSGTTTSYQGESATLSANATTTSVPLTAAVTNTHTAQRLAYTSTSTGVAYALNMYPDVVLLNRNVKIQGSGATTNGYLYFQATANASMTWAEFNEISGTAAGKRGLEVDVGPSGTFSLTDFSVVNSHNVAIYLAPSNSEFGGTPSANVLIQHGVFYNDTTNASPSANIATVQFGTTTHNPHWEIDDIAVVYCGNGSYQDSVFQLISNNGQFSNISVSGSAAGGSFIFNFNPPYGGADSTIGGGVGNTFGPFTTYSNIGGIAIAASAYAVSGKISGFSSWHENGRFNLGGFALTIDPFYFISAPFGIYNSSPAGSNLTVRNGVIGFDGGGPSKIALQWDSTAGTVYLDNMELCPTGALGGVTFISCERGISLVSDLTAGGGYVPSIANVKLRNSSLLSGTNYPTIEGQEGFYSPEAAITQDCPACSPTPHAAWLLGGFLSYDTSISHTSGHSLRLTPRVNTFSGYISSGSGSTTSGTTLTVTNSSGLAQPGDALTSNGASFITGTELVSGAGTSYTVSQSQSVGSSASPVQFQDYWNTGTLVRLQSAPANEGTKIAVTSGTSNAQACVWIRPSINTDAAPPWGGSAVTYNGDAPRMVVRQNPAMGVQSDTVLATDAGYTAGTWTQLCGTLPTAPNDGEYEVVVDADQTFTSNPGGSVNVAEWSCTNCQNSNLSQFWWNGTPQTAVAPASSGGGGHIIGGALLKRDLDPASNDNSPAWLSDAA